MAGDPGTALAIISLGITVCEGIIHYCNAFKDRKADLQSLTTVSTELQSILQDVQVWLRSHPSLSDSLAHKVDGCVKACLAHIDEVLSTCLYFSPMTTRDLKSRIRHVKRGLEFPLKGGTIQKLKDQMEALRANVMLALNLVSSDLTFEGFETLKKMIQQFEGTTSQSIETHFNEAKNEIGDHISSSESSVQSNIERVEKSISAEVRAQTQTVIDSLIANVDTNFTKLTQSRSRDIRQLEFAVVRARVPLMQSLDISQRNIDIGQRTLLNEIREIKQLIHRDRDLNLPQHPADPVTGPQMLLSRPPQQSKQPGLKNEVAQWCTCNAKLTKDFFPPYRRRWFQVISDSHFIHDRNCPMWYTSRRKVTVGVNIRMFRFVISGSVEFSGEHYSWRNWSAAPSPSLRYRAIVPSNSGAFAILDRLRKTIEYSHHQTDRIAFRASAVTECLAALHEAFASGKASPHDIDENGSNMLHVITDPGYDSIIRPLGMTQTVSFIRKIQSLWNVDLYGANDSDAIRLPRTPIALLLDCAVKHHFYASKAVNDAREFHFLLDLLVESGLDLSRMFEAEEIVLSGLLHTMGRPGWGMMTLYPSVFFPLSRLDFSEATRCNPLHIAILKKDERSLRAELGKYPASLSMINRFGQNCIHFATEWTDGLRILLRSGYITNGILNQLDVEERSGLDYAALQGNIKSAQVLIEADACFGVRTLKQADPSSRKLLISALYERRRQLTDLAMRHELSENEEHLGCLGAYLLDNGAFLSDTASRRNLRLLEASNVEVPDHLRSSVLTSWSLFHQGKSLQRNPPPAFDKHVLQDLITAGFVHVDEVWDGITPLMDQHSIIFEIAELLLERGADANKELPLAHQDLQGYDKEKKHRAVHKLALQVGWSMLFEEGPGLAEAPYLQKAIFQSSVKDPCSCYCSPGGCTPLVSLLKETKADANLLGSICFETLSTLLKLLGQFDLSPRNDSDVAMELIRMMTFESLELTHTCCIFEPTGLGGTGLIDMPRRRITKQVEIHRIHDEERELLHLLETLMKEFTAKFTELGMSIGEFLSGYWKNRMKEELYRNEEISADQLDVQREHGIWLRTRNDLGVSFFEQLCDCMDRHWLDCEEDLDSETENEYFKG